MKGLRALVERFSGKHVLLAGDLVADEYLLCRTSRVSREAAAALVLTFQQRELRCGGGANAAANVCSLGGRALVVGVVGQDDSGDELCAQLEAAGADTSGVLREPGVRTVVKTRILTGTYHSTKQQVLRLDREQRLASDPGLDQRLALGLSQRVLQADALLVSDYGYGAGAPQRVADALAAARSRAIPVTVDSRHRLLGFTGVTSATPNEEELEEALGLELSEDAELVAEAGERLRSQLGAAAVVVTRGSRGMLLLEQQRPPLVIPVFGSDEVADVTGAGDTVIAAYTLALAAGGSFEQAARLANVAGGMVVLKQGTGCVGQRELLAALEREGLD